ncbi:hypothetical protein EIKCOROL_01036 [Eikenella corrodens ATCC 23834]|uniref:Uncharacterized protein n=1 Tax=Eikenella corrodens ATCC 23834 TaxID=546274 RepID=C0DUK4_EIKCO|nr:hypothetical protein EIKCOROL_01036 [Eikenella corrodens ATCC 23834]
MRIWYANISGYFFTLGYLKPIPCLKYCNRGEELSGSLKIKSGAWR